MQNPKEVPPFTVTLHTIFVGIGHGLFFDAATAHSFTQRKSSGLPRFNCAEAGRGKKANAVNTKPTRRNVPKTALCAVLMSLNSSTPARNAMRPAIHREMLLLRKI